MKKKIIPILVSSLLVFTGCDSQNNSGNSENQQESKQENQEYPVDIRIDEAVVTEYCKNTDFVTPKVYSVYAEGSTKVSEEIATDDLIIDGYNMQSTGKQTVSISYRTKDANGKSVTLTKSYDIYVFGYNELPKEFKSGENCFKKVVKQFYDLKEVTKITGYDYSDQENYIHIIGTSSLEGTTFSAVFEKIANYFDEEFTRTSFVGAGVLETGDTAFTISYIDDTKNYDMEMMFVNKNTLIGYEVYFYPTNKVTEWPEFTVNTVLSWITNNEETVPQIEGDVYSFNVSNFQEYGIATINAFTQENPTEAYEQKLRQAGYSLIELPESYTFFYNKIAVSSDKELAMEYGYENGMFTIGLFQAQDYEFNATKAQKLITVLNNKSTATIPALDGALTYKYFPELINTASVTAFRAYNTEDKLEGLLSSYKQTLAQNNWEALNNGEADSDGGFSFVAPSRDIKINVKINDEEKAIEAIFSTFIDPVDGWPYDEINSFLTKPTTDIVPAFRGEAESFETFNDWYKGIVIYVKNGNEEESKAAYIDEIEKAGYVYSEEETKNHYNDPTYVSPNGQILLTVYSYGSGSFTIDVTCTIPNPGEYGLELFLKEHEIYDENAAAFIEATKGKYTEWVTRSESHGNNNIWYYFVAAIEGDVTQDIATYATAIGCDWYGDENPQCWYNMDTGLEIDPLYDSESNTTYVTFIY